MVAELAGMNKFNFEIYLSKNKIPIFYSYNDIENDLEKNSTFNK
jgi:predicted HTH domain antitoxin